MLRALALVGLTVALLALPVRANSNVDLVLVLALDVSSSVDAREFDIQKNGLVLAFRHAAVIAADIQGALAQVPPGEVLADGGDEVVGKAGA